MISAYGGAMMRDLSEVLSIEDCHDLLEIADVDAHNRAILSKKK